MDPLPLTIITGPTASGKSALALDMAQQRNGVIINADSLQLYQGLPILTACPSPADHTQIPHRLYETVEPNTIITAPAWCTMAYDEICAAHAAGQHPFLVGGTGFYIKTLLEGLSPIPDIAPEFRHEAETMLRSIGLTAFLEKLRSIDPQFVKTVDPKNPRRLVRAYEVYAATGKPMSYWQAKPKKLLTPRPLTPTIHKVIPERHALYARCNARLDVMLDNGVLDEIAAFDQKIARGEISPTASLTNALGFQAFQSYLHGEIDFKTARTAAQNQTRHYAKRQVTWLRHQLPAIT